MHVLARLLLWVTLGCFGAACGAAQPPSAPYRPFAQRRAAHPTQARGKGALARPYDALIPPPGVEEVTYSSGLLALRAWLARPEGLQERAPALMYLHGDFVFRPRDFELVRPFLEQGFVVMTPMLRAENGNPGDFELLWGEVDDARAAVRWLASQPGVDPTRIYVLGHSVGGALSALLSLYPEPKVAATASVGGIYVPSTFSRWAQRERDRDLIRFDPHDRHETELRVLGPNVRDMVHPHVAFVGTEDRFFLKHARAVAARAERFDAPFSYQTVAGDHMSSVPNAVQAYLAWIARRAH